MTRILHITCRIIVFFVLPSGISAQSNYTESELKAFAEVYMAQKNIIIDCDTMIRQWLHDANLPEARYGEILRAEIQNTDPEVTASERISLAFLRGRIEECDARHHDEILKLCHLHNLDFGLYSEILISYKSRVAFQRQVQPYLISIMQSSRNE